MALGLVGVERDPDEVTVHCRFNHSLSDPHGELWAELALQLGLIWARMSNPLYACNEQSWVQGTQVGAGS